jgi:hypothetical protein
MARLGVSRFVVDRVTNHLDQSVTGRHYDLNDYQAEKREALDSWAAEIEQIVGIESLSGREDVSLMTSPA